MLSKESIKNFLLKIFYFVKKYRVYFVSAIVLSIGFYYNNYSYKSKKEQMLKDTNNLQVKLFFDTNLENKSLKDKRNYLLGELPDDIAIGNKKARVSIVDYSSYTCQFCRHLRKEINSVLDILKKEKPYTVKYTLRPIANRKTLLLNVFLSCYRGNKKELAEEFFTINWLEVSDIREYINKLIDEKKLDKKEIFDCLNLDEHYRRNIYYQREADMVFNISQTPLLVINGKKYYGFKDQNELLKIISRYVAEN